jgi:hypothetical protein
LHRQQQSAEIVQPVAAQMVIVTNVPQVSDKCIVTKQERTLARHVQDLIVKHAVSLADQDV